METKQTTQDSIRVYDLNALAAETDFPAKVVYEALRPEVEAVVEDPVRGKWFNHAIMEIIRNVQEHGIESEPRLVVVKRELGELAIDTTNTIAEDTGLAGLGHFYAEKILGEAYSHEVEGGVYMGHLTIRHDTPCLLMAG